MCKFPHDNSGMPVTFLHHPLNFAYFRFIFMSFKTQYLNFLSVLSENLTFPDPHHPASAQKLYKPPAVLLSLLPLFYPKRFRSKPIYKNQRHSNIGGCEAQHDERKAHAARADLHADEAQDVNRHI